MFTLKSPAGLNFSWIIMDKDKTDCFECFFNIFSAHVTKCFLHCLPLSTNLLNLPFMQKSSSFLMFASLQLFQFLAAVSLFGVFTRDTIAPFSISFVG